jgi:diguanylate cyclase (GGDEF)-like protein
VLQAERCGADLASREAIMRRPGHRRSRARRRFAPVSTSATLSAVAGRLTTLLGGVAIPLYAVGAVVTNGAARWVLLGMTALLAFAACLPARQPKVSEAPYTVATCVGAVLLWGWLAPAETVLLAGVQAAGTVYLGLMVPRPHAEIGLGAVALAYLGSPLIAGTWGDPALQMVGVAATDLALGALLLGVRVTTERKVDERTQALAAANERLEQLARTDPLTGLANRRRLEEVLARAWAHAGTTGRPVAAIMSDIDHFKQYNDHYGHLRGDGCLQRVAGVLAAGARGTDVAARYGGEEFAVILPGTGLEDACRTAERLRTEIAGMGEEHALSPCGFLTVSIGVAAALPGGGMVKEDLIQQADDALYRAKRDGRNRIGAGPDPARLPAA